MSNNTPRQIDESLRTDYAREMGVIVESVPFDEAWSQGPFCPSCGDLVEGETETTVSCKSGCGIFTEDQIVYGESQADAVCTAGRPSLEATERAIASAEMDGEVDAETVAALYDILDGAR